MPQPAEICNMVMNIVLFPSIKATVRAIPSAEFQRHSVRSSNSTLQVFLSLEKLKESQNLKSADKL